MSERLEEAIFRLTQNQTLLTTTQRALSLKFDSVIYQLAALTTNIFPPPSLNCNMFFAPSVTGPIPAMKMATIAVLRTLDLPTPVVKGDDEKTVKLHELIIAAAEKYQPAEPRQDPLPIFRMLPQFTLFPKNWSSPPSRLDTISTISLSDSRHCSDFYLLTPDLVRVSCPERLVSTNTVSSRGRRL